jgi:protein TonB
MRRLLLAASFAAFATSAHAQPSYVSRIAATIQSQLFYPPSARARGAKGVVGVAFTIGASGRLSSFAITRSSGDKDLDKGARTMVEAARFPPPSGGAVHVAMNFDYALPVAIYNPRPRQKSDPK